MPAGPSRVSAEPEPESPARAAAGGFRAARKDGRVAETRVSGPAFSYPVPAAWLDPSQPALWEGRTEAFRTPQSCEETKDLRPRFCLESHLRTWRQPRQVGGLSERTPLPRGLGDTGAYPWGQRCLSSGRELRAFTVSPKMELIPHLLGLLSE